MHAEVLRDSDVVDEEFEKVSRRFLRQFDKRPGFTFFSFGTVTREMGQTVGNFGNSIGQSSEIVDAARSLADVGGNQTRFRSLNALSYLPNRSR